ncbi:hypothetical protein [Deinococcus sp.]|uniref:hypothetical protein n=1 Tax=Deinococcus sp. TaxID=47478 RepID=UPI003C7AF2C2
MCGPQLEEHQRRAMAAVVAQDFDTLLGLMEAHHVRTHGHVSTETPRNNRLGAPSHE